MANHTVKAGDCFSSIAKAHGFYKYSTLYDHADNAALKLVRTNPNQLVPGDVVAVPAKRPKKVDLVLDGVKDVLIQRTPTHVQLHVTGLDKAVYTLTSIDFAVGSQRSTAQPDGAGKLELQGVDPAAKDGTLTIVIAALPVPPVAPVVPVVAANPPAHPPPIVADHFKDKPPTLDLGEVRVRWSLHLGTLEPRDTVRGVLQRLVNLGLRPPVGTAENDDTRRAVKHFQSFQDATTVGSGHVSDVRADVATLHDQP